MIDVIYLVKDKNRCHVYEPPQGLEISGPEAARDRSSYAVNRGQGQKSMGMAPGPEAAAAGRACSCWPTGPTMRPACSRRSPGAERSCCAARGCLEDPDGPLELGVLALELADLPRRLRRPPSPGRHRAIFLPSEGDVHETRDGSFRERGKGWCIAARRQALGYGLGGDPEGVDGAHAGLVGTPTAP